LVTGQLSVFNLSIPEPRQITTSTGTILSTDYAVAIIRNAPSVTTLTFPAITNRSSVPVIVFDWSTNVTSHNIVCVPNGTSTFMQQTSWSLYSNEASLAGAQFYPSISLNGWYIAP
jgi:hypothetical protein